MLRFHAGNFLNAFRALSDITYLLDVQEVKIGRPDFQDTLRQRFKVMREHCTALGLPMSVDGIDRMLYILENLTSTPGDRFRLATVQLVESRLEDELKRAVFMQIPPERVLYFEQEVLFGDTVRDAFPSAVYDVREAGTCYAVGRNTACVFHLMRVLEIGLNCLANQFNVPVDHTNWDTIINRVESEIRTLGKDRARKGDCEYYSQAASYFRVVKDAWRNYTAHARGKYDEHEAIAILANVKDFMQQLSERLREPEAVS